MAFAALFRVAVDLILRVLVLASFSCADAQLCSRFIPLVRDAKCWKKLYDEDLLDPNHPTAGELGTYVSRGWCRLELIAGLAPKKFSSGSWRPGPRNIRFRWHHDPTRAGVGPLMTADLLRNPLEGNFSNVSDCENIKPVLVRIALRYAEYAASGSDAWDATIDIHSRPQWLKALAGVAEDAPESPAVDPLMSDVSNIVRPFQPAGGADRRQGANNKVQGDGRTRAKIYPGPSDDPSANYVVPETAEETSSSTADLEAPAKKESMSDFLVTPYKETYAS